MPQALVGVVVQVYMGDLDIACWERVRIHNESMILRGDLNLTGQQVLHGMI